VPKFEIGYWCRTGHTGHGYITEAVKAITTLAIDTLGARRVEIRCDPTNHKSASVAKRAGFQLEATLHNNELGTDGNPRDTLIFSRLSEKS
jgi:RimJ/RimL family protein N-acetyltransferase